MKSYYRWRWWAIALRGVVALLFGIAALYSPGKAFLSLVLLFGIFAIVNGVLALGLASRPAGRARTTMIAEGVISIIAGVLALVWPSITALGLLMLIAAWSIVTGILELSTAIRLRKEIQHEWLLGIEGVLSIAFGVLLFISPLAGAVVLGLWVGAYALVLGGMLIGTGFRLRSATHSLPPGAAAAA